MILMTGFTWTVVVVVGALKTAFGCATIDRTGFIVVKFFCFSRGTEKKKFSKLLKCLITTRKDRGISTVLALGDTRRGFGRRCGGSLGGSKFHVFFLGGRSGVGRITLNAQNHEEEKQRGEKNQGKYLVGILGHHFLLSLNI